MSIGASERMIARNYVHGLRSHPLYSTWRNMLRRCESARDKAFPNYGGRGVKVCPRWHVLANFIADMHPTYRKGLTIERIDVNGDYELFNCTWIPRPEQARNRTDSLYMDTPQGRMLIVDASRIYKIKFTTLRWRIVTKRMSSEQALSYRRYG
jgi:hypothetical protein